MDKELLYRFFEGSATEEEMRAIQKWMDKTPANRKEFLKQRKLFDALLLLPGVEDETALLETERTREEMKESTSGRRFLIRTFLRYAAAIIISIGATLAVMHYFIRRPEAAILTASVPAGQRAEIMLPDSTTVWLNSGSVLKYPSSFTTDKRTVYLDGEGYFTVTGDKHKPFTVETLNGYVTVLGTIFNLKSYSAEPHMETSLVSGMVKARGKTGEEILLKPHQKMIWDSGRTTILSTSEDDYLWKKGILTFTNRPLSIVLYQLGQTYDKKVVIRNKSLGNILLSGKFRISDGMDYALRVLKDTYGFRYFIDPDSGNILIY